MRLIGLSKTIIADILQDYYAFSKNNYTLHTYGLPNKGAAYSRDDHNKTLRGKITTHMLLRQTFTIKQKRQSFSRIPYNTKTAVKLHRSNVVQQRCICP